MQKAFTWIKANKFISLLILVLLIMILGERTSISPLPVSFRTDGDAVMTSKRESVQTMVAPSMGGIAPPYYNPVAPSDTTVRMVSTDTSLSLKVNDVSQAVGQIESIAVSAGGYLIDSNVSLPQSAASGTVSIRVLSDKRNEALSGIRAVGVKVVSQSVSGQDITDQFVDNAERLRILESTKLKFQTILDSAKTVSEMLEVQAQLLSLQSQIDAIKGTQKYLEGSAKYTRITVYLSTDELSLPYAPDNSWRPAVIFKEAVRSLLLNLRSIGSLAIWAIVYVPVVIVAAIILWVIKKLIKRM